MNKIKITDIESLMSALLKGLTLKKGGLIIKLRGGLIRDQEERCLQLLHCFTDSVCQWEVYDEPPKWQDNIPKEGIPCWVRNNQSDDYSPVFIFGHYPNNPKHRFDGGEGRQYKYAFPMSDTALDSFKSGKPGVPNG